MLQYDLMMMGKRQDLDELWADLTKCLQRICVIKFRVVSINIIYQWFGQYQKFLPRWVTDYPLNGNVFPVNNLGQTGMQSHTPPCGRIPPGYLTVGAAGSENDVPETTFSLVEKYFLQL